MRARGTIRQATTDRRWQWAKENSACFKCLIKRHQGTASRARKSGIDRCKLRHRRLLHESRKPTPQSTDNVRPPSAEGDTTLYIAVDRRNVLYKVMLVEVIGPHETVTTSTDEIRGLVIICFMRNTYAAQTRRLVHQAPIDSARLCALDIQRKIKRSASRTDHKRRNSRDGPAIHRHAYTTRPHLTPRECAPRM
ncbi:hypothetical protein EVAR_30710_1 [Eumeta japonica]|uniref:Uncharacterized protein n=1 Tax=Eumeta variegata TaxID=151549 RepID=A0A4C1V6A4_EUMVA|nr:hypothetical protein EVAR_30710_1 [Eumeta japonica]